MSYKVEPIPDSYGLLGEGPHWDIASQSLYFVDIYHGMVMRYDYAQNKVYKSQIENEKLVSFIIPVEGTTDKFVVGIERRIVVITWDGISKTCKIYKEIASVEHDDSKYSHNAFNDGKCDPRGRLFTGTTHRDLFKYRIGHFYRFDKNGQHTVLKDKIGISNGLAWNENTKKMYYIDSIDLNVKEFDYDFNTGEPKNPKVLFDLENLQKVDQKVIPDGMTIDSEGFLYVATFGGSTVYKVDPKDGSIVLEIKIPCELVTSAAFGGPNLDILYVTTSALFDKPAPSGTTYKVTGLGAKGVPMAKCILDI